MLAARDEIADLDPHIARLVKATAPELERLGIGTQTAAVLLVTAGDNPDRLKSEGAFAHLTGTAPLPASSGKVVKYRLNCGGDRQANWALHMIAVARCSHDERTAPTSANDPPMAKRTSTSCARGSPGEVRLYPVCALDAWQGRLKRYIAREVFKILHQTLDQPDALPEAA